GAMRTDENPHEAAARDGFDELRLPRPPMAEIPLIEPWHQPHVLHRMRERFDDRFVPRVVTEEDRGGRSHLDPNESRTTPPRLRDPKRGNEGARWRGSFSCARARIRAGRGTRYESASCRPHAKAVG